MTGSDPVFSLDDLARWSRPGVSLAVLGHPIKHSISPPMHNAALAVMAARAEAGGGGGGGAPAFADWRYHRFEIHPDDLPRALELLHEKRFLGVNLTVPHKIIAFSCVARVDPAARPIGAVNTLKWTQEGWHGFNTDGYGLATAVRETLGITLADSPVVLLGAGGAARGAAVECIHQRCAGLWIANRTRANLDTLLSQLAPLAAKAGVAVQGGGGGGESVPEGALVINATSSGLRVDDPLPVELERLPRPAGVYDMIYNPPETRLLARARALGLPAANGLSMLIHQGARSLQIWSGAEVPVEAMRKAAEAALRKS
ncbi:shikimate dehydrogenase family protein [Geminisphaera colitermitum]|uniref:shikimate dehydrogenase family protein n=1 Tax=Geminisphaera colitermitum TaxID=1148786 RepID=UPI0005B89335|nr:shikimate dehydrogenase [Geminisphaera colitermitum]